jgi:hypothetical protein
LKHFFWLLDPEEEHTLILQNHLPNDTHIPKDSNFQDITCN